MRQALSTRILELIAKSLETCRLLTRMTAAAIMEACNTKIDYGIAEQSSAGL